MAPLTGSTIVCLASPDTPSQDIATVMSVGTAADYTVEQLSVSDTVSDTDISWDDVALGIALGGDGTFLEAVHTFTPHGIPILAVNTGTLGFLARIPPSHLTDAIEDVLAGDTTTVDRELLTVTGGGLDSIGINDVMVEPRPPESPVDRKVATVHAYLDDAYVGAYTGSGVAVSTPTGSTAVALSAGGPIHYPTANSALQLTPLQTHAIGVRPLIADSASTITLYPTDEMTVTVDGGRSQTTVTPETELTITGAEQTATVIRTEYDETFFDALAGDLGWSLRDVDESGPYDPTHTV